MTLCEAHHGCAATEFVDATGLFAATQAAGIPAARVVAKTPSTNTTVRQWAYETALADLTCVAAEHQSDGRGRRGRSWQAPAGANVAASVWCCPPTAPSTWPWLTMMAALAITDVARDYGIPAVMKWPNDVLVLPPAQAPVTGRLAPPGEGAGPETAFCPARAPKLAGVLAEAAPDAVTPGAVVGFGVNVGQAPAGVGATSFADCCVAATRTDVLAGVLARFADTYRRWVACGGDAVTAGIHAACVARLHTVGQPVVAYLPDDQVIRGQAVELTSSGALAVAIDGVAEPLVITAGDVVHVRQELR